MYSRSTRWAALATTVLAIGGSLAHAQETKTVVDDGPYVFWTSDGGARVVAVCDGWTVERFTPAGAGFVLSVPCLDVPPVRVDTQAPSPETAQHTGVSRILAIGDVHGQYRAAVALLRASGVVDQDLRWSFGDGHLVFDGDVLDRGTRVTETLWLIYRLEREAKAAGGRVHLIVGNHEVMALQGDLRYVHEKYLEHVAPALGMSYDELFGPTSELGRWLRTRNTVAMINGLVFVHGGLSPEVARLEMSLVELNDIVRANIDTDRDRIKADPLLEKIFGSLGPLWYRGYFMSLAGYEEASAEEVRLVLDAFDAQRLIVGHTGVDEIESRYGGLVIAIHVAMTPDGCAEGLLWEDERFYRIDCSGERTVFVLD